MTKCIEREFSSAEQIFATFIPDYKRSLALEQDDVDIGRQIAAEVAKEFEDALAKNHRSATQAGPPGLPLHAQTR